MESLYEDEHLAQMLLERMNTEEQQLFVRHFQMYLKHGRDDTAYVVDLDDVWVWIGFTEFKNARRCVYKHFAAEEYREGENLLLPTEKQVLLPQPREQPTQHGGHNKLKIMMTVRAFKELCLVARTEKAKVVRGYYLKMEEILQDYIEHRLREANVRMTDMEESLHELMDEVAAAEDTAAWAHHRGILSGYKNRNVVYIMHILGLEDGRFVVKIGSTDCIQDRVSKLSHEFGIKVRVMDVWACERNREMEKEIHHCSILQGKRYTEVLGKKASMEAFLMDHRRDYEHIKRYIGQNVHKHKAYSLEHKRTDIERLSKELEIKKEGTKRMIMEGYLSGRMTAAETQQMFQLMYPSEPIPAIPEAPKRVEAPDRSRMSVGPRVQIYDPEHLDRVVRVWEGIVDVMVDMPQTNLTQIKAAARDRVVYHGYRWHLVPRQDPMPEDVKEIGPTETRQRYVHGMIAQLEDAKVIAVFPSQKLAAESIGVTVSMMSATIKRGGTAKRFHWKPWAELCEEQKATYMAEHTLPEKAPNLKATRVRQTDPETGEIVREFASFADVQKATRITSKLIKEASETGRLLDGYTWQIV